MTSRSFFVIAALALLVGGVAAVGSLGPADVPPAVPAQPSAAAVELVLARPFQTQQAFRHDWHAEGASYDAGWLVVLAVDDPALVHPRQVAEPVLFGGAQTLQRINTGVGSGHLVAVLPGPRGADGGPAADLGSTPFFFGEPALPESIDAAAAEAALALAWEAGARPASPERIAAASLPLVTFADMGDVQAHAADLIEQYAPGEVDLVSGLRAPRLTR